MTTNDPDLGEVRELLERAMVARIATVSRNGRPHVNPLYFVLDGDHIHLGTAIGTLAARNVRAHPVVQVLFEIESDPRDDRALRVLGDGVVRSDPEVLRRYRRTVARKYVVTPGGLWNMLVHPRQWKPMRRHLEGGDACVVDMTPSHFEIVCRRPA